MTKTRVKFNATKLKNELMKRFVEEQTRRLVDYAREELQEMIASKEFQNQTFNLADSYVWVVYYDGKVKGSGYVGAKQARKKSFLHAWSSDPAKRIPVDGRKLARAFISAYKGQMGDFQGWVCVWAACAPYSKYLDPKAGSTRTNHFFVISQRYDHIKATFEPKGKVIFNVVTL